MSITIAVGPNGPEERSPDGWDVIEEARSRILERDHP